MNTNQKKRPPFFSALCILTFIGSTVGFIAYFLASLFFEKTSEFIIKYSSWYSVDAISPIYFTVLMVLFALSLTGAIRMWKFHRDGFYLYVLSQITVLFLPVVWISWNAFSETNAVITGAFIIGYGLNWRRLN